jgi:hypothetical protein
MALPSVPYDKKCGRSSTEKEGAEVKKKKKKEGRK